MRSEDGKLAGEEETDVGNCHWSHLNGSEMLEKI